MADIYSHALLITGARTWDDEQAMRSAFREVWRAWDPARIARAVLISGHCPDGADALAEGLWRAAGFEVMTFPADWQAHGRDAGFRRNQAMVEAAVGLRTAGIRLRCAAFLDLCRKAGCPQRGQEQLMPRKRGHFSHGTVHCRQQALRARIDVLDVFHPSLPPF